MNLERKGEKTEVNRSEGRSIRKGGLERYQSRRVLGERNEELDKGSKVRSVLEPEKGMRI